MRDIEYLIGLVLSLRDSKARKKKCLDIIEKELSKIQSKKVGGSRMIKHLVKAIQFLFPEYEENHREG